MFILWETFSLPKLSWDVFFVKVNDSMIIKNSMNPRGKGVSMTVAKMMDAVTFRIALKAVRKNCENMS